MSRRVLAATVVVLTMAGSVLFAQGTESSKPETNLVSRFQRGNALYERARYDEAVAVYDSLVAAGAVDADVFFNLGNAHFKRGEIGWAVLNWNRALRIAPRDADVRANLDLASTLLVDKKFAGTPVLPVRILSAIPDRMTTGELAALAWGFYLLWFVAALGFVFRDDPWVARMYLRVSMLSPGRLFGVRRTTDFLLALSTTAVLTLATGATALTRNREEARRRDAIVVVPETAVYSAPAAGATLQFKVHEGTRVRTARVVGGRVEVRLPGELSGWLDKRSVERI